jgi:hypothetical protein
MVNQINGHRLYPIRPNEFRSLGLELWQLQDRDPGRRIQLKVYRNAALASISLCLSLSQPGA